MSGRTLVPGGGLRAKAPRVEKEERRRGRNSVAILAQAILALAKRHLVSVASTRPPAWGHGQSCPWGGPWRRAPCQHS